MINRIKMPLELYSVEAFFNRLTHEQFILALNNFSRGVGYNPEDMTCFFPSDIVEDEGGSLKDYKYIEFWEYSGNEEVRLTFSDFINILKKASLSEIKLNPKSENKIKQLTKEIEKYLNAI